MGRQSSLDSSYTTGKLSQYPVARDTPEQLYIASNNASTYLVQSLSYSGVFIVVNDTTGFPPEGLLSVGTELIYYGSKTSNIFQDLSRGFAGSRQNMWSVNTTVSHTVQAEMHNAVKDALINIEQNLGLETTPTAASLNGLLKALEARFLAPKAVFKAIPPQGFAPLTVAFQSFSAGSLVRYLWDFGDGATDLTPNPIHTYVKSGTYTVTLNVLSSLGSQGITTKTDYITVSDAEKPAFFYVTPVAGTISTVFDFVDQTDGAIVNRYWIFDDGATESQIDPNIHYTSHVYSQPGSYNPTLLVVFQDQTLKRLSLSEPIVVS